MSAPGKTRTVFLYSGQGSHYCQMGAALFEGNAVFRTEMLRLDEIARESSGIRVVDELYSPGKKKSDRFDRTLLTHAAIFMVEHSLTQALKATGVSADILLSSSLGTFAAAVEAGCLNAERALAAVLTQAQVFEKSCPPGGMIAVVDRASEWVAAFAAEHDCEVVAINAASPSVIAAEAGRISAAEAALRKKGVVHQRLAVSHAFHTRWIDAAETPFREFVKSLTLGPPRIPIACCTTADLLDSIPADLFWHAARRPIQFEPMIARLKHSGRLRFVDLGPSGSLATALKHWAVRHGHEIEAHSLLSPFGNDFVRFSQTAHALRTV